MVKDSPEELGLVLNTSNIPMEQALESWTPRAPKRPCTKIADALGNRCQN